MERLARPVLNDRATGETPTPSGDPAIPEGGPAEPGRIQRVLVLVAAASSLAVALWARVHAPLCDHVVAWVLVQLVGGLPLVALAWTAAPDLGRASRAGWGAVVLWAAVLRAVAFSPEPPSLSDDVYRYLWEGRVVAAGRDPYAHAPLDPALADLAAVAPEWSRVNHPELPAIYPPLAQLWFGALSFLGAGEATLRGVHAGVDLLLVLVLARLLRTVGGTPATLTLYAWHPLPLVEVGQSGHYEPVAILPLALALHAGLRGRPASRLALLALTFGMKVVGGMMAPFLLVRLRLRDLFGSAALMLLPSLVLLATFAGGWPTGSSAARFAGSWRHNGTLFPALAALLGDRPARGAVAVLFLGFLFVLRRSTNPAERLAAPLFLGLLALSPVVHPWYALWVAAFVPLAPHPAALLWTLLVPFGYLVYEMPPKDGAPWEPPPWVPWLEATAPLGMAWAFARARGQAAPSPSRRSPQA